MKNLLKRGVNFLKDNWFWPAARLWVSFLIVSILLLFYSAWLNDLKLRDFAKMCLDALTIIFVVFIATLYASEFIQTSRLPTEWSSYKVDPQKPTKRKRRKAQ